MTCNFCNQSIIDKQGIFSNESIVVIYPQKPIISCHFIIFPRRHTQFISDLTDEEFIRLKEAIKNIFTVYKEIENCIGYNLSSNNGSETVGQTVPHAHMHLYLRFENEKNSPYKTMADNSLREILNDKQWQEQKELSKSMLNK